MSALAADFLVGAIVAVSACYCVWRMGPRLLREALRPLLKKLLPRSFKVAEAASACNGCSGCALVGKNAGAACASDNPTPARAGEAPHSR